MLKYEEYKFYYIAATSLLAFILLRIFVQGKSFKKSTRCDGKVVVITGGNTGIGLETAVELAKRGAKVYIACRSLERGERAVKEIVRRSSSRNVHVRKLDLASFDSIREFVRNFLKEEQKLDILINNAGVMAIPLWRTEDGLEMQIGVNHFGHFLLTNLLLPTLKGKSSPEKFYWKPFGEAKTAFENLANLEKEKIISRIWRRGSRNGESFLTVENPKNG